MNPRKSLAVVAAFAGMLSVPGVAHAQLSGTQSWQQQPYCNVIVATVTWNGMGYTVDGYDDQCGTAQRAPVVGTGTINPDGSTGLGLTVVTAPGGRPLHLEAVLGTTFSGTWRDSSGRTGSFAYFAATGGAPRPAPTIPAAALAAGAVTTTTIANGTIAAVDVRTTEIQRRVSGVCAPGTFVQSVAESGFLTCTGGSARTNAAVGSSALAALSTGSWNTAAGVEALLRNTSGDANTAVGFATLTSNTTGGGNTGLGYGVMLSATTGSQNTAIGTNALFRLTTGIDNVAVGSLALTNVTATANNVAVGRAALQNATGSGNTALGDRAGIVVTSGSNNILIGHVGQASDAAVTRLGTPGTQTKAYVAGVRGVTTATAAIPVLVGTDGQLGTVSSSRRFKQDIADMGDFSARLAALRPVTFRYTQPAADGTRPLDFGLVAEEVAEVFPELAVRGADGQIETVAYHKLPALLLNELQRQQRVIDALVQRLQTLETARERR